MAFKRTVPQTVNLRGTDCTGNDGDSNRTYTLSDSNIIDESYLIIVNGASLHEGTGTDFTQLNGVITFLNAIFDTDYIRINYATEQIISVVDATGISLKYATTLQLANSIGIVKTIPSRDVGATPIKELVGTGDGSTVIFYLDHDNILANSYTLYYGSAESSATELTETTHYTLDKTSGKVTLTSAGKTLVATNKIYAAYNYTSNEMSDAYLTEVLLRAEQEVDNLTNTTFTDVL